MSDVRIYCRFCAEEKQVDEVIDLQIDRTTLKDVLTELSHFPVDFSDLSTNSILPKYICFTCRRSLYKAQEFIVKTSKSKNILIELISDPSDVKRNLMMNLSSGFGEASDAKRNIMMNTNSGLSNPTEIKRNVMMNTNTENRSQYDLDVTINQDNNSDGSNNYESESSSYDNNLSGAPILPEDTEHVVTSWSDYPWICGSCDQRLPSLFELRDHCVANHDCCFAAKCVDCSIKISNFNAFITHAMSHRTDLKSFCKFCNYKFNDSKEAYVHTKRHYESESLCFNCGKLIINDSYLTEHCVEMNCITWKSCNWLCSICLNVLEDVRSFRRHCIKEHNKCFTALCVDCGVKVKTYNEYVDHLRSHLHVLKHHCHICSLELDKAKDEVLHIVKVHQPKVQVPCPTCGVMCRDKYRLHNHYVQVGRIGQKSRSSTGPGGEKIQRKTRPGKATIQDLTCPICDKVMSTRGTFKKHLEIHNKNRRRVYCERCGKGFTSKGSCDVHVRCVHEGKPLFACKICNKKFPSMARMKNHLPSHNTAKPFVCNICSKAFKEKKSLQSHGVVHSDEWSYKCPYCEKRFKHHCIWKTHLNQHTGEKPYSCTVCPMKFSNWSNCDKHMKRRHGLTLSKTVQTPMGRLPVNLDSDKELRTVKAYEETKKWAENFLATQKINEIVESAKHGNQVYGESHTSK